MTGLSTHELRERYHMTQEEFAYKFYVPLATVRNWDARKTMPVYVYHAFREVLRQESLIEDYRNFCK